MFEIVGAQRLNFGRFSVISDVRKPIWRFFVIFVIPGTFWERTGSSILKAFCIQSQTFWVLWFWWFFACSVFLHFWDFGCPDAQFWEAFSFLGALGLIQNSWKCATVVNFKGLTPFGRSLVPGLDNECVLRLGFLQIFRFWMVLGSHFLILLVPIVVRNQGAKKRAAGWFREILGDLGLEAVGS